MSETGDMYREWFTDDDFRSARLDSVACITGGRYVPKTRIPLKPSPLQMFRFLKLLDLLQVAVLWDGDAIGTDRYVRNYIRSLFQPIRTYQCPVDNRMDGPWPAAGHRRNRRMLETSRASKLIAFPGDRGTNGFVEYALRQAGVGVWQWDDDEKDFVRIN